MNPTLVSCVSLVALVLVVVVLGCTGVGFGGGGFSWCWWGCWWWWWYWWQECIAVYPVIFFFCLWSCWLFVVVFTYICRCMVYPGWSFFPFFFCHLASSLPDYHNFPVRNTTGKIAKSLSSPVRTGIVFSWYDPAGKCNITVLMAIFIPQQSWNFRSPWIHLLLLDCIPGGLLTTVRDKCWEFGSWEFQAVFLNLRTCT